jgi:general secretion pathway protein A
VDSFSRRVESLVGQGGFALLTGEPGVGKSKALELLAARLARLPDLSVGVMERPQSRLADFYRELGELFAVPLTPLNRYGGFKALRARWHAHCEATSFAPCSSSMRPRRYHRLPHRASAPAKQPL